jgi:16S rRNA (guanine527-N7)-methyltransferase
MTPEPEVPMPGTQGWPELADQDVRELHVVFDHARDLGLLGPGPVMEQITRSVAFAAVAAEPKGTAVDLGSGGGLPALVLALVWPASSWLLIDSNQRRTNWLRQAATQLGAADRVEVICQRAELVGRGAYRYKASLVTARGFGPPAATAECAAPLLALGGCLLVADPPEGEDRSARWPQEGLSRLGLQLGSHEVVATRAGPVSLSRIFAVVPCDASYPRRVGVPFKRLLF